MKIHDTTIRTHSGYRADIDDNDTPRPREHWIILKTPTEQPPKAQNFTRTTKTALAIATLACIYFTSLFITH